MYYENETREVVVTFGTQEIENISNILLHSYSSSIATY